MTKTLTQVLIRSIRFLLFAAAVAVLGHDGAHAQQNNIMGYNQVLGTWNMATASHTGPNRAGTGSPAGRDACTWLGESYFQTDAAAGQNVWYCTALPGTWTNNGGAGSVTSFSAGTLSPLFTTSVATATTTPALSFILSNFSADNIFGNFTGSSAAPSTQAIPACANDGSHALVYPSHTFTCEAITTFTWPSAGIMVSTGSAAGASLTTTSGLEGFTFTAGVPSLTTLGTAATSNSSAFQPATTGAANEVFGGTGPAMIALTSSYLPLSSMGTITGGTWNGSVIAGAYGGTGVANTGFTLTLGGNVAFTGSFNPNFSIPSSSTWTFQSGGGTLAQTGADINGSNQVTSTHLAFGLPRNQGGLNSTSAGTGILRDGTTPSASELSGACTTNGSNVVSCIPAGGGIPGGVADITSPITVNTTTETNLVTYSVPANTIVAGTAYRAKLLGIGTSTAANTNTFNVYWGPNGNNTDTNIGSLSLTAATTGSNVAFAVELIITFRTTGSVVVGGTCIDSGGTGISNAVAKAVSNTVVSGLTTSSNEILTVTWVSGATTTSAVFGQAGTELVKP